MTETSARPAAATAIYRGMDRAALDAAYNNGAAVAYTLAPEARFTDIVEEIRQALSVLRERAGEFGFDRDRLFVGGWSAGGHLTAIVSDHPASRGGLPISGIFDLEPIALNYLNEKLAL